MLNQTVLVGRLTQDLNKELIDNDGKVCQITISVPRSYKNDDGKYDVDFIPIVLTDNIGKNVCEYCKKGDVIGIRGRIESFKEKELYNVKVIAERFT